MSFSAELLSWLENQNKLARQDENDPLVVHLNDQFKFRGMPITRGKRLETPLEDMAVIWEDTWRLKRSIVEGRLKSILGLSQKIHGRETVVVKLHKPVAKAFLEEHHLVGGVSAAVNYGLMHKSKLVALACFAKPCPIHRENRVFNSVEVVRFCSATGHTVVGGLSKLIKHYLKFHSPDDLMTSIDREWNFGKGFIGLGFSFAEHSPRNEFWIAPHTWERIPAAQLPAHRSENALLHDGWTSIKNKGNDKLILMLNE